MDIAQNPMLGEKIELYSWYRLIRLIRFKHFQFDNSHWLVAGSRAERSSYNVSEYCGLKEYVIILDLNTHLFVDGD